MASDPSSAEAPVFSSSRIVRWADCSESEREQFAKFFAENQVAFFKDADGSYAANIRLYDRDVLDPRATGAAAAKKEAAKQRQLGADGLGPGGGATALFDFGSYGRFCADIGPPEATRPKDRTKADDAASAGGQRSSHSAWLMRLIEEVYDARYAKDTTDLKEAEGGAAAGGGAAAAATAPTPFPTFVVEFFTKRFGLRSLIDQHCWDLLYNTHKLRREHTEVEVFARFLDETYDPDDLLFFLYVRSVVQKELNYNFRSRWSEMGRYAAPTPAAGSSGGAATHTSYPGSLQMTFRDCSLVSRVVFGSESDPLYKTFMAMIERNMSGKKSGGVSGARAGGGPVADGRKIDVSSFLHLAVVEYHETRPAEEGGGGAGIGGSPSAASSGVGGGGDEARLFREAAAAYDQRTGAGNAVSPAGGSASSGPRPSPALLEALGETMHRSNEAFLDRAVAAAAQLPREVQAQIRTEVQSQLESKVDAVLAAVITVSQGGSSGGGSNGPEIEALAAKFAGLVSQSSEDAAVGAFCAAVLASAEVAKTITPLVALLVQYASSRLREVK